MKLSRLLCAVGTTACVWTATAHGQTPVVISQVYGASLSTGSTYNRDFVELYNRTNAAVDVSGWSVQYASQTGSTWQRINLTGSIPAYSYYLIQMTTTGTIGAALPTPDCGPPASTINMAAASGKVALVDNQNTITGTGAGCPITGGFGVVDFVGYGLISGGLNPCAEGGAATGTALTATTAAFRNGGGCDDSNNNNIDFSVATPAPRNTGSPIGPACVLNQADLSMSVSGAPDPAYVGLDTIVYTGNVVNGGGGVATASELVFTVPAEMSVTSSVPAGAPSGSNWVIPLGDIGAAGSVAFTINCTPLTEASVTANFTTSTTATESSTANNGASDSLQILVGAGSIPVTISQVYPGGGSSSASASFNRDYVELFNRGNVSINLNGRSLQYQSATGTTWTRVALPNVTLAPGQYFLAGLGTTGTGGAPLPAVDVTSTTISMSNVAGKIALVNGNTNLPTGCVPSGSTIIDFVAWGVTATCAEGSAAAWTDGDIVRALHRLGDGCTDTNDNNADMLVGGVGPRSTLSTIAPCGTPGMINNLVIGTSLPALHTAVGTGALTYTGNVTNLRSVAATNSVLTVVLPTTCTGVSSVPAGSYNNITGELTIPLGSITGAVNWSVSFTPTVEEIILVPISVAQTETDLAPDNNTIMATTVVQRQADLSVAFATSPDCQVPIGPGTLTHTVTATNSGPETSPSNTVTVTMPSSLTAVSATPSAGSATISGSTVTWDVGSMASAAAPTLAIVSDVNAIGEHVTSATIAGGITDPVAGNNTATRRNTTSLPRPLVLAEVVATSVATAPAEKRTLTTAGLVSGNIIGNGSSEAFGRPFPSPDGSKFVIRIDTDALTGQDQLVVVTTGAVPTLTAVLETSLTQIIGGGTLNTIDVVHAINDAGQIAFSGNRAGLTAATDDFVARRNADGSITVIAEEGSPAPGATLGENIGASSTAQDILADGRVLFQATLSGATGTNAYVALSDGTTHTVVAQKGITVPTATPPLVSAAWNSFTGTSFDEIQSMTPDGLSVLNAGAVGTVTTTDDSLAVSGDVKIQEGSVVPGSSFATNVTSNLYSFMEDDANWFAYGSNSGTGSDYVVRNGTVIAETGGPIFPSSSELWSDSAPLTPGSAGTYSQCFFNAHGRGADWVVSGLTDVADGWTNGVSVTASGVLIREGDPIDLNGNGLPDDNAVINTWRDDRMFVGSDGYVYAVVSVRSPNTCGTPTVQDLGAALIRIPLGGGCPAGCNLADITETGGTLEEPGCPDGQLTLDDILVFIDAFNDATGCPGTAPCNLADITETGGTLEEPGSPDGQLTLDDILVFIDAYNDATGC